MGSVTVKSSKTIESGRDSEAISAKRLWLRSRHEDRFSTVADTQLSKGVLHVPFHRGLRQSEALTNLSVGQATRSNIDDFNLARGQLLSGRARHEVKLILGSNDHTVKRRVQTLQMRCQR